jgi:phosphatidylglycerol:prolipoprotein diacylglycerol transferase
MDLSIVNPLGISPIIFSIDWPFHLELRWYGVMYLCGYFVGYLLLKKLIQDKFLKINQVQLDNFIFYIAIGMVIGARVVYSVVYDFDSWIKEPLSIIFINRGGLSFHGAVIGMSVGAYLFARKNKINFFRITDAMALAGSPGLFFGRMGNFINGELYGRVTDSPLGMVFPLGGELPRHASMLYEGIGEGLLLTAILWMLLKKFKTEGYLSAVFLGGYAICRFIIEFFREPDQQLGYYFNYFSMGQILCTLMLFVAFVFYKIAQKKAVPLVTPAISSQKAKR